MSPGCAAAKAFGTPTAEMLLNGFARLPSAFGPADLSTKIVLPWMSISRKAESSVIERSPVNRMLEPNAFAVTPS